MPGGAVAASAAKRGALRARGSLDKSQTHVGFFNADVSAATSHATQSYATSYATQTNVTREEREVLSGPGRLTTSDLAQIRSLVRDELSTLRNGLKQDLRSVATNQTQSLVTRLETDGRLQKSGSTLIGKPQLCEQFCFQTKASQKIVDASTGLTSEDYYDDSFVEHVPISYAEDMRALDHDSSPNMSRRGTRAFEGFSEVDVTVSARGVFGDLLVKPKLTLDEKPYNVEDFYNNSVFAKIASNHAFINATLAVITLNAFYMWIDADLNDKDYLWEADLFFIVAENTFCIVFTVEIFIRFLAFQFKYNCLKDMWFKFDSCLVILMIFETYGTLTIMSMSGRSTSLPTGPLKLLRMLRLSRLVRLMRKLPELMTMVKGMRIAMRAVGASLLMVLMLTYVFAIMINSFVKDQGQMKIGFEPAENDWKFVGTCMWTLILHGTLMDSPGRVLDILRQINKPEAYMAISAFLVFLMLSAMTVLNMLIGVLCEVVSAVGQIEKEEAAVHHLQKTVLDELKSFDDGDALISKEELNAVMSNPTTLSVLRNLDVDVMYLKELQAMLFTDPDIKVPIEGIMELILNVRGDLPTTISNMTKGLGFTRWALMQELHRLDGYITAIADQLAITLPKDHTARQKSWSDARSYGNLEKGKSEVGFSI